MMARQWTEKSARARSRRKINAIRNRATRLMQSIAYEWGDVDQSVVEACDELLRELETACEGIEELMDERVREAAS